MRRATIAWCLLVVGLAGCGEAEPPFTDNSEDSASYARDVKELVLDHAAQAKGTKDPADPIRIIVQELSNLKDRPAGDHLSTLEKLSSLASSLLAECEKADGKPPGLDAKLNELIKTAQSLPGEVATAKEPGK